MSDVTAVQAEPLKAPPVVQARILAWLRTSVRESANAYALAIFGLWSAELLLLVVLQTLGTGMGLRVRQTGEDRVWDYLIQTNTSLGLMKAFWAINDRNPLSPWWYLAARPLLELSPYGIYLVRKMVDLFLALSVFMLVDRLGRKQHRLFAMACSVLTLLWGFTGYTDQIMWNFLGALGVSLLMLWAYCKYVDSARAAAGYLGLSLVLYLLATATYTLQCSTFLAVFAIAIVRTPSPGHGFRARLRRIRLAAFDSALYVSLFGIFTMFWYTAARPSSDYYALSLRLIPDQFFPSLRYFAWHFDYPVLLRNVLESWPWPQLALTSIVAIGFFGFVFSWVARNEPWSPTAKLAYPQQHSIKVTAMLTLVVAVSTALATLAVESMSAVWLPGLRSRMVQQVFQPLLYLGCVFLLLNPVRRFAPQLARRLDIAAPALFCTVALIVGLQFNRQLNANTGSEERFEAGLKSIVPNPDHTKFIVLTAPGVWHNSDSLSEVYVRTFYRSNLVNMRVLQRGPAVSTWKDWTNVIFGPDDQGVLMGDAGATDPSWIPYSRVRIVWFDGQTVSLMQTVGPSDLAGFTAGWQRSALIQQSPTGGMLASGPEEAPPVDCSFDADLGQDINGSGWSVPERTPDGSGTFRWMASTVATENLDLPCQRGLDVQFRVIYAMSPDILRSTSLTVDGQPIELRSVVDSDGATLFEGTVPADVVRRAHGSHELRISVARTIVPEGGERSLGLALDRLELRPAAPGGSARS